MAEPKRIQLTTVTAVEKEKKSKSTPKTIRINLTLKDSTDTTCPEFSYTELTRNEGGDVSQDGSSTYPFGDEDDDGKMAAIARAYEEKYAPKPKKCKKGGYKDHLEDLIDLGEGYDEDDPFIDNAEAYDEVVPVCMTTTLGGFYINSGLLDFKYQSEDSVDEFRSDTSLKKKKKVKQITSDTDSEVGDKKIVKKRKLKDAEGGLKKKKRLLSSDGKKINKTKLGMKFKKKTSPTVAELLKDQRVSTSPNGITTNGDTPVRGGDGRGDANSNPTIGSTIDSLLEQAMKDDSSQDLEENDKSGVPESITALPSNIPESLLHMVNSIKLAAIKSSEGKCKFFTNEVNNMLLSIEVATRQLTCGQRSSIYGHLAAYLPCSKETLLKRAKKLRLNEVDDKLRDPINNLREAINKVMPALMDMHEAECQLTLLARQEGKERGEGEIKEKEDGSTESDEEDKSNTVDGEKKKRIMGPRKRFEWCDETRKCLLEVVKAKMQCYDMLKTRMQSPEEYLRTFLDAEIKPLWPPGWMQTRMLYKESKVVHAPWTNPLKHKKTVTSNKQSNNTSTNIVSNIVNKVISSVSNDGDKSTNNSNVIEISNDISRNSVPTLLDYAEKTSPINKLSPNISPTSNPLLLSATRNPSKPHPGYTDMSKSKDNSKHHLVSEILQKPLSVVTSNPSPSSLLSSSPKSPHLTNPNPKESNFFMEFQKHLSKQLSPNSQDRHGLSPSGVTSSAASSPSGVSVKPQFKSPQNKVVEISSVNKGQKEQFKSNEAMQKQYQAQMNKARQVAAQQKQTDQQLLAELQFQKAYLASVQSSSKSTPQITMKQFSPKTTSPVQSQKSSTSGRDQILAQIQAELGRNETKLKFKQPESKTSQKIIEDAVMQQMFKQPLPASSGNPQRPLLQQALRASPVSATGTSPTNNNNSVRQPPVSAHHPPSSSRPMTSLLSPTSRNITVDLTAESPPKMKTSPTHMTVKRTSPTNQQRHDIGHAVSAQSAHRPGYVVTSSTGKDSVSDCAMMGKVFMQPISTQQSPVRHSSGLSTSANKNMQDQWKAAFGVNLGKGNSSAFSPPVSISKTVASNVSKMADPTYMGAAPSLTYNDVCELLGVPSGPTGHQGNVSSQQTAMYSHSPNQQVTYSNTGHNPGLLYQQQHHGSTANMLSSTLPYGHLPYTDTSQKPHGQ
ncbi:ubinuclein-2 isoform X1 [Patella vulgata]|uniref:ubinuclein-2 isoform X1 n=1 Tax=Patella vulgata TaxID=6465 RepID=UPI0024A920CE|nr:ubinuclein-2 isoform X1 [Patella vulgata]